MAAKLAPFFLRVRICSSFIAAWLLNLGAFGITLKSVCNPGMNCHGCPWALGACPIGVLAYGSAVHALPVYAISFILALAIVLGRLSCAFLCPFGLLQDLLYKIPFFKIKLPAFVRHGKYLALALLVFLFPFWLGFEQSGFLRVDKPKVDKAEAAEGEEANPEPQLDVVVTVTNLGRKPVEKPQLDLVYLDADKKEIFRAPRKEFPDVVLAPAETRALPAVRVPNKLADGTLLVSSPQSEVQQTSPYQLYYCRLCPVGTLESALPAYAAGEKGGMYGMVTGRTLRLGILIGFLLLMLMVSRPFCRILCPLGAIYGLLTRLSLARMTIEKDACVDCGACNRVCPVDLDVPKEVSGAECIACGDCMKVCPKSGIRRVYGL
jgi:ferredoxin